MTNEILIGIGGLLLSVLTYFAGVWRTEKRHKATDKRDRLNDVVSKYMDLRKTNATAGLDGLQKSGISTLHDDSEIREAIQMIIAHGEKHPLHVNVDDFENIDLKVFFDYAASNSINFLAKNYKEVISESGA